MFNGTHVDLDHILTVSPAYFDDRMGSGGYFVAFHIQFILRDRPIVFDYEVDTFCRDIRPYMHGEDAPFAFASKAHLQWEIDHALPALQHHVDELIAAWSNK
jgi:hypothetical protein